MLNKNKKHYNLHILVDYTLSVLFFLSFFKFIFLRIDFSVLLIIRERSGRGGRHRGGDTRLHVNMCACSILAPFSFYFGLWIFPYANADVRVSLLTSIFSSFFFISSAMFIYASVSIPTKCIWSWILVLHRRTSPSADSPVTVSFIRSLPMK